MRNCYIYQIIHLSTLKSYIGSRTARNCRPSGIGIKYFSSSNDKDFLLEQKMKPENFIYFILKEFGEDYKSCIEYEIYLHNKYDVGKNNKFYNRSKQTSKGFSTAGIKTIPWNVGIPCSEESKMKNRLSNLGRKCSEETKQKMRKPKSVEHKRNMGLAQTGEKNAME